MDYIVTFTTTDTDGNTTTTERKIKATDARTAHNAAEKRNRNGAEIRVYPSTDTECGIMRGAVIVGRRTAINAIQRQGTPTQYRIEREFSAINARLVGAETAERVAAVIADYSADTQDFFDIALLGLQEGKADGAPIAEQYHNAYLTLNRYIHAQRAATDFEISTEFLTDGGGDLVSINTAISAIIRGGSKWTPTDGAEMDAETAARLGKTIADAMRVISPTQRRIAELLGRGYSQRQIAAAMGRHERTIKENVAIMRGKIAAYIGENAIEFTDLIRNAETAAASERNANRRTADGAAREKENCKARHNAEYYREYRARKAAERQAAKQNG